MSEYREDYEEETWQDVFLPKESEIVAPQKQKRSIFKKNHDKKLKAEPKIASDKKLHNKKRLASISIALIIVIAGISCIGYKYLLPQIKSSDIAKTPDDGEQSQYTVETLEKGTPTYSTVLPSGTTISKLGGWTRVSPETSDPVYAYVDKINGVSISISEQPLPDDFKSNPSSKVEKLATGFNADAKITVSGTTAYIGTSSDGAQSVILYKKSTLILIKSVARISNNDWANYINSLK